MKLILMLFSIDSLNNGFCILYVHEVNATSCSTTPSGNFCPATYKCLMVLHLLSPDVTSPPATADQDDEFDMFAQSRKSTFDESRKG